MPRAYDAVVVGAGPNGLAAAIVLARAGQAVLLLEANDTIGGGCRTADVTLPGFHHDICAAVLPMAIASPLFQGLPLQQFGVSWVQSPAALAHPFDDGTAALLHRSVAATGATIGPDAKAWARLMQPFLERWPAFVDSVLRPVRFPRHPWLMARLGLKGLRSGIALARSTFAGEKGRALFGGCAAHSILPMDAAGSASFGLVLALAGHAVDWPIVRGGSQRLMDAMAAYLRSLGGEIETSRPVRRLTDLPPYRCVLFDLMPATLERIAGDALPSRYRRQLRSYRHGPGVFKLDWALSGPIPWHAAECASAATVHLGATLAEIVESEDAAARGRIADRPFVLVAQPSLFDDSRAPHGAHTGWAYCHVPNGSVTDMTDRIERQVERFAPGFRDLIIGRNAMPPARVEARNANMVGGDVSGGANDLAQLMFRPVVRWNPYTTPNEQIYLCSSATPPGGGVHGMCGYWAAQAALRYLRRRHRESMGG
jgi:phytoene dehydrogenase-like protein